MTKRGRHTDAAGDAGYPAGTGADASFWTGQPEHQAPEHQQGDPAAGGDPLAGGGQAAGGDPFPGGEAQTARLAAGDAATQQIELPTDAFDDDLEQQLAELAPRPVLTRTTLALASVVLLVAGFLGGVYVQRSYGQQPAGGAPSGNRGAGYNLPGGAFPSGFANRQGRNGAGQDSGGTTGTGGTGTTTTTGKVKLVDGTTIYIETPDGQTVIVKTDGSTTVQATQPSTLKDLAVGAQVSVEGTGGGESITATKITKGS